MIARPEAMAETITFSLDGRTITAYPGETILQAAERVDTAIPHLCYAPGMRPDGNCRACMVEIEGERVLAPSCCRPAQQGMVVHSKSGRAINAQRMVLELLQSDMSETAYTRNNELDQWARHLGVGKPRFESSRTEPPPDLSHPRIHLETAFRSGRLHSMHTLRTRVPRRAGQRCNRLRPSRPRIENCI